MIRTLLALSLVLAGCRPAPEEQAPPEPAASKEGAVGQDGLPPPAPQGKFLAHYAPSSPEFEDFREGLIRHRFLDTIALRLNDSIKLPKDITLTTAHCAQPNASYDPDRRRVTLCYELFEELTDKFAREVGGEYLVSGTLVFALMHELGHAIIDVLELPIVGREEDAVDQLATILLLNQGPTGDSLAFGAVGWFALNAPAKPLNDIAFADEHGLNQQRVYNIICWIYGRAPTRYREVVREGWLPEDRARGCQSEFLRLARNWERLLSPYRPSPVPDG